LPDRLCGVTRHKSIIPSHRSRSKLKSVFNPSKKDYIKAGDIVARMKQMTIRIQAIGDTFNVLVISMDIETMRIENL
jgi:hypothetical protein